jgi:arylsulfatase
MFDCIPKDKPFAMPTAPRTTAGWHKGSCAALLGATMLMSLSGPAITPVAAQQQLQPKPNILFIMGDDSARIGLLSSNDSKEKNDYTKVSNALCH